MKACSATASLGSQQSSLRAQWRTCFYITLPLNCLGDQNSSKEQEGKSLALIFSCFQKSRSPRAKSGKSQIVSNSAGLPAGVCWTRTEGTKRTSPEPASPSEHDEPAVLTVTAEQDEHFPEVIAQACSDFAIRPKVTGWKSKACS